MSDLPRLLTLQEASAKLGGKIKPRALRTEARHGRLHLTRIAGKDFVTTQTTWQRQRVDADESVHAMRQMLHQQHVHEHAGNRRC